MMRIDDIDLFLLSVIAVYNLLGNRKLSHILQAIMDKTSFRNYSRESFERLLRRRVDKLVHMRYLNKKQLNNNIEVSVTDKVSVEVYSNTSSIIFFVKIELPNSDIIYYPVTIITQNSVKSIND